MDDRPIGFFDSGVGGLSIWRATRRLLPRESLIFLADRRCFPYGAMTPEEVRTRTGDIVRLLHGLGVKLVVVACNTATVHSIGHLQAQFPEIRFVGVVPTVKTLARRTRTGTIGVLSTVATAESAYLADLIRTFAPDKQVVNVGCDGLADLVEAGDVYSDSATELLEHYLAAVRSSGADVLGLGCTHYSFLCRKIKRSLGSSVRLYEPSGPVARRVRNVLAASDSLAGTSEPSYRFYTTGDAAQFTTVARRLLRAPSLDVQQVAI